MKCALTILAGMIFLGSSLSGAGAESVTEGNAAETVHQEHDALRVHLDAVEAACYKWRAKCLLLHSRSEQVQRRRRFVALMEGQYSTAYAAYLNYVANSGVTSTNDAAFLFLKQEVDRLEEVVRKAGLEECGVRADMGVSLFSPHELRLTEEFLAALERRRMELMTRMFILESVLPTLTNSPPTAIRELQKLNSQTFTALQGDTQDSPRRSSGANQTSGVDVQ